MAKDTRLHMLRRLLLNKEITTKAYFSSVCLEYEFKPKQKEFKELSDTENEVYNSTDEE